MTQEANAPAVLHHYDPQTKRSRQITQFSEPVSLGLSLPADEKWILWSQIDQAGADIMLVENFR